MRKIFLFSVVILQAANANAGDISIHNGGGPVNIDITQSYSVPIPTPTIVQTASGNITVSQLANINGIYALENNMPRNDMRGAENIQKAAGNMGLDSLVPASGALDVSKYMNMEGIDDANAAQFVPAN